MLADNEETEGTKKILIAKKFLLEKRILTKVIENLGYDYDILDDMSQLESKIASGAYDIVFTDAELVTDTLKAAAGDTVAIITDSKEKEQIEAAIKSHRG